MEKTSNSVSAEMRVRSMDIEKAIDCLKADKEYLTDMKICEGEEIDIAIEALKKKIPQKTNIIVRNEDVKIGRVIFNKGTKVHHCPECNMTVTCSDYFCRNCGQALIW